MSLSLFLKSTLSASLLSNSRFFMISVAIFIFFNPFIFNLRFCVYNRFFIHIILLSLDFIQIDNLCFLIGIFMPLPLNIIIDVVKSVILLFVFHLSQSLFIPFFLCFLAFFFCYCFAFHFIYHLIILHFIYIYIS